jgi:hypothetical protein
VAGGLRRHRRGAPRPAPARDGVLHVGPREPRGGLPIPALRAALRAQQPARQLEHVPRDDERGPQEGDRLVRRDLRPGGLSTTCDLILFFGQNTGTSSPRFLHPLKAAKDRGCRIVTFNPLREKGLVEFVDPQNPAQMTLGAEATKYLRPLPPGAPGRRHRCAHRHLQARPGARRNAAAGYSRPRIHRRPLPRLRRLRRRDARVPHGKRSRPSRGSNRGELEEVAGMYSISRSASSASTAWA